MWHVVRAMNIKIKIKESHNSRLFYVDQPKNGSWNLRFHFHFCYLKNVDGLNSEFYYAVFHIDFTREKLTLRTRLVLFIELSIFILLKFAFNLLQSTVHSSREISTLNCFLHTKYTNIVVLCTLSEFCPLSLSSMILFSSFFTVSDFHNFNFSTFLLFQLETDRARGLYFVHILLFVRSLIHKAVERNAAACTSERA